jgi:hypothetical protein
MKRSDRNWALVRAHYETSRDTLRQVALRFGIPERTVFRRSAKEGWHQSGSATDAAGGSGEGGNGSDPLPNLPDDGSISSRNGSAGGSRSPRNGSGDGSKRAATGSKKAPEEERFIIPDGINEWNRLEAARFYVEKLGWAIHPPLPLRTGSPASLSPCRGLSPGRFRRFSFQRTRVPTANPPRRPDSPPVSPSVALADGAKGLIGFEV